MRAHNSAQMIEAISTLRATSPEVFGGTAHRFELNLTLRESEVRDFERRFKVNLPEEYRKFLIKVGNGGAGPHYGIFPLGYMDHDFDLAAWTEDAEVTKSLSEPFQFSDNWNDLTGKPSDDLLENDEEEFWRQMEAFEKRYWGADPVRGSIPICHEGCAIRILIIVTGDQKGFLWEDRPSEYRGLKPLRLKDGSVATFSTWYHEWLQDCFRAQLASKTSPRI